MKFSKKQFFSFTRQEVCSKLDRAANLSTSEIETMYLSDRLEPWLELFRPISHNVDTRLYYWPEIAV